jgi:hypothetical protein
MLIIKKQFPINKVSVAAASFAVRQNAHRVITSLANRVKAARGHIITRNRLLGTLAVLLGFFGTYYLLSLVQQPANRPIANVRPTSSQPVGAESKGATQTSSNQTTSDPSKLQPSTLWQPTSAPTGAGYAQTTPPVSSAPVVTRPVIVPAPVQQPAPTAGTASTTPPAPTTTNGGGSPPPPSQVPAPVNPSTPTLLDTATKTLTDPLKPLLP